MGEILNLIPLCDSVTKIKAKCEICNEDAIFSHRIVDEDSQVLVGGSDKYVAMYRHHFLESNNLPMSSSEITPI